VNPATKRTLVTYAAGFAGVTVAVGFSMLISPPPRGRPPQNRELSREAVSAVLDTFIVCFGVAYTVGRVLYSLLGLKSESQSVREVSGQHMPFMHWFAAVFLLGIHAPKVVSGTGRPLDWLMTTVGLLWLAISGRAVLRALPSIHPFGLIFGGGIDRSERENIPETLSGLEIGEERTDRRDF
jgi:hypothetical protein